jgi:hypothetical protein
MKNLRFGFAGLAAAAILVTGGCGGSDYGGSAPPPPPPPPPMATDYTQFVKAQFAATADTTDPEAVDGTDFALNDQDNPGAFDDLLAAP